MLAQLSFAAAGALVDGVFAAGLVAGTVTAGPGCWWRRRNAVLRQALLQ